jgi:hypothetical protein
MLDISYQNTHSDKQPPDLTSKTFPMFRSLRLKNFRSHKDSRIDLSDLTLIIGSNNSGKSNFLTGIHYISKLIGAFNPEKGLFTYELRPNNYHPNKHSLCAKGEPIEFMCEWNNNVSKIEYELSIYPDSNDDGLILGKERLTYHGSVEGIFEHGHETPSNELLLRRKINELKPKYQPQIDDFFYSLSTFYYYNLQPTFLKGEAFAVNYKDGSPLLKKDYLRDKFEKNRYPNIPSELGKEGTNLQELLLYIKEMDEETYNRFSGYLKRFVKNFNGLILKDGHLKWQFDMGSSNFPYYDPDKISDGLVKAAAVALLCSIRRPPSLIMIEEVENGINQRKLNEFLSWLIHTSDNSIKTQFILTSHSPSVIREFSDKLDTVFNFHLRERDFVTRITNINDAIKPLVNMGTVVEESTFTRNGKEVISVRPYHLIELFYNGVLGEL